MATSSTPPECIIHVSNEDLHSNLTSPRDFESWSVLLRAARLKKHKPLLMVAEDLEDDTIPPVHYHLKCRKLFTLKRDLEKLEERDLENREEDIKRRSLRPVTLPSSSTVFDKVCIFCPPGKHSKYIKGSNTREHLVQCLELKADARVREIARQRQDQRILAVVSRELVAAEAWYHKSCYRQYTNEKSIPAKLESPNEDPNEDDYQHAETYAFSILAMYIRDELFTSPKVVKLTDLTHVLATYMHSSGVAVLKESTKKHLRRKLEREFGDMLHMTPDDKGKILVYPNTLNTSDLAKENQQLKKDLDSLRGQSTQVSEILKKASVHLRSSIKGAENKKIWPFLPSSLNESTTKAPAEVTQFLFALLTGDLEPKNPSQRTQMLVDSFSQDLVYAVSAGTQIPITKEPRMESSTPRR
uniref:uncharacterized protein n=1 Tax=Myxine glutinosa TaxID=7769 RepID=UPI0035900444